MAEINLEQLARLREERWETRRARIETDPTLDPGIQRWYLNRTPLNTRQTAALLRVTDQRVSAQRETSVRRSVISRHRQQPHPSVIPTMDTVEGMLAGVPDPGVEAGVLIEWAVMGGRWELRVYQPGDLYVPEHTMLLRDLLEPYTGDDPDTPVVVTEPDTWALTNLIKEKGPQTGRVRRDRATLSRPAPPQRDQT